MSFLTDGRNIGRFPICRHTTLTERFAKKSGERISNGFGKFLNKHSIGLTLSGPAAFPGFRFFSSFSTPGTVMLIDGRVG